MKKVKLKPLFVLTNTAFLIAVTTMTAVPAHADSSNYVDKAPAISDDYDSYNPGDDSTPTAPSTLYIEKDNIDITANQEFSLILPANVKWDEDVDWQNDPRIKNVEITNRTDSTLDVRVKRDLGNNKIEIPMYIEVDGASGGPVYVKIDARDSVLTPEEIRIANISNGTHTVTVNDVKKIGTVGKIGTISIDEATAGELYNANDGIQEITIRLPQSFKWNIESGQAKIRVAGGFEDNVRINGVKQDELFVTQDMIDDRTLSFTIKVLDKNRKRGTIYIDNMYVEADSNAKFGDVIATVQGDDIESKDVKIAEYADYGVSIKVDEIKQIVTGTLDSDEKIGEIEIKENVANSLIQGRNIKITLPSKVKVIGADFSDSDLRGSLNTDKDIITIPVPSERTKDKYTIKLKLALALEIKKAGDIMAKIEGAGIKEQELLIAKSVPPGIVKTEPTNIKIGLANQSAPDIILVELAKGAVKKEVSFYHPGYGRFVEMNGWIQIILPKGVTFASMPSIDLIEGDAEIDKGSIRKETTSDGEEALTFDIKGESSKPSKIRISNMKVTADRTLPLGKLQAKITGTALVNPGNKILFNSKPLEFDYLNVITPVEETVKVNGLFTIGSKTYKLDETEKTMDVAPYIKNERTYLPIRYAAEALGVSERDITFDQQTGMITLFKGNTIAQLKIGSNKLWINGTEIHMDTAVEIKENRAMLPLRYVAQAFGSQVNWDPSSQTISIR